MAILIIGGAGFIGSHLVNYYLNLNKKVIAIDDLSTGKLDNIKKHLHEPNFKFYQADILTWPDLEETLKYCELVYDLAAIVGMFNVLEKPITTLYSNINITERLLSTIAKLKNKPLVIIASSSEVYGLKLTAMKETDSLLIATTSKAHASYPISKLCNEITGIAYYKEKQVPTIIVRIFNTVGAGQSSRYGMVLPRFIQQAIHNKPLTVFSDGQQTRSFCDVRDMCNILHQLTLSTKSIGEIVNVGNEKAISILNLATLVKEITQSKSTFHFQNYDEVYGKDYIDIQNRKPDLTKLKSIIHYEPCWQLKDTILNIIDTLPHKIDSCL